MQGLIISEPTLQTHPTYTSTQYESLSTYLCLLCVLYVCHMCVVVCEGRHGTGHGVGAFLNVHEGPQSISFRKQAHEAGFVPGMVTSNEPGFNPHQSLIFLISFFHD